MSRAPHINKTEFEVTLDIIETSAKLQRMRALADSGNVQAAWYYGNILLTGGWDESRMDVDYLRGNLLPETPDPRTDPYLIVPRDQYAAVHYHKIAASFPDEKQANEIMYSRAILGYCRTKSDIGYYGATTTVGRLWIHFFENYAKAASPENVKANPFIPYPYKRPEVKNPKTKIFGSLASIALAQFLIGMSCAVALISMVYAIILSANFENKEGLWTALIAFGLIPLIAILIPLLIAFFVYKQYGLKESMPICSCAAIKKSYQSILDRLPEDCRAGADPFVETPLFIRNFHHIKQVIFAINVVASLIFIVLKWYGFIGQTCTVQFTASIWVVFLCSILILFLDKQWCLVDRGCDAASKPILFDGNGLPRMG